MQPTSFVAWFRRMTVRTIRLLESPQSLVLPSGKRLRGIALGRGIYLARDRKFYQITTPGNTVYPITEAELLARLPFRELISNYNLAAQARAQVRRKHTQRAQSHAVSH